MKIDVVITPYHALPCALQCFTINGKSADEDDFGEKNWNGKSCMDGKCGYEFEPKLPTQEVIDKYGIDLRDYADICDELRDKLFVCGCGWCS